MSAGDEDHGFSVDEKFPVCVFCDCPLYGEEAILDTDDVQMCPDCMANGFADTLKNGDYTVSARYVGNGQWAVLVKEMIHERR